MTSDDIQVEAKLRSETLASFGQQLKSARENMGLSLQEAALRLHLSPRYIDLLENEDISQSTLPPIYLRGYLRSYAKLLNISSADIAAVLEMLAPTPAILTASSSSKESPLALSFPLHGSPFYTRLATFFVALVLLASITTWWNMHGDNSNGPIIASATPNLEASSSMAASHSELVQVAANTLNNNTSNPAELQAAANAETTPAPILMPPTPNTSSSTAAPAPASPVAAATTAKDSTATPTETIPTDAPVTAKAATPSLTPEDNSDESSDEQD